MRDSKKYANYANFINTPNKRTVQPYSYSTVRKIFEIFIK